MRYIISGMFCKLLMLQLCFPQDKTIDSLLKRVATAAGDSLRSLYYAELASNYSGYDTSKALHYLQEAYRLNKKIDLDFNWGCYYKCYATYIYDRGDYSRSLQMTDTAFGFFNKLEKKGNNILQDEIAFQKAELLISKGASYTSIAKSEEALLKYQEALRLLETCRHPLKNQRTAVAYTNIANVFFLMEQYDKGLEYDLKSVPYYMEAKDDEMLAYAFTYVASDYMRLEKDDSAKVYFSKAEPLVTRLNKNTVSIEYYGKIGEMYWRQKDWKNTRKYYTMAYENAREINQVYNEIEYLRGIANCYYNEKKHKEADKYLQEARKLTEEKHLEGTQRDLYWTISRNYHHMGNYKLASDYMLYYTKLNDSIAGLTLKQKITEMDELFQSQKRQQEIVQLQKEKKIQQLSLRQKSILNYILVGGVGALLVIGLLAYRNFRNKQKLSQQTAQLQARRISELEKEKQLLATQALLKGQEEERSRLAKDLHDGLGGMLSGVKLSLGAMKGNLILSEENARLFSKTLDQLDNSIGEMRRVAHNMMPEALVRLGLQQAVQDYCDDLTESQQQKISCQFHGLEERLDAATEIVVYRIVQELLNNVVKHSGADEILVQVMRHDNNLNITVEDNGKGFDVKGLDYGKGAGLGNVRSRVDYLKGQLDIQSVPGKGTSVHIDCVLDNN